MRPLSDWKYTERGQRYRMVILDPDEEAALTPLSELLRKSEEVQNQNTESLDHNSRK